jgi:hypothetical protein
MRFMQGEWDRALHEADEFIAECEAGSPHLQESSVREVRAFIPLARDDVEGALTDLDAALAAARETGAGEGLSTPP